MENTNDRGPALVERIVADLARRGVPRSTGDLAREFLGLGLLDEAVAERLLGPLLGRDARLVRTPAGWTVAGEVARAPLPVPATALPAVPVDAPFVAALAPWSSPVAATWPEHGAVEARLSVAAGGEAEVRRAEERLGIALPRPALDLLRIARRLHGYVGVADLARVAEVLGLPHLDVDSAEGRALLAGSIWSSLAAELAADGVADTAALDALLEERLERADLAGRAFSEADLAALPAGPGVYLFRDAAGRALYVGQSGNLAARVGSYFIGPPRDEKDRALRARAVRLETKPVETAPDALVLEARWIRRFRPRLNTRLAVRDERVDEGLLVLAGAPGGPATPRVVLFVLRAGGLALRLSVAAGPRRVEAAVARAVAALFAEGAAAPDREAGVLVDAWRRAHPGAAFLRPGLDGGPGEITRAALAAIREFDAP